MSVRERAIKLGATDLVPSWHKGKKFAVLYKDKYIHFGSQGYEDYTMHHDPVRRASYRDRHKAIKLKDGRLAYKVKTQPAFWAMELLW